MPRTNPSSCAATAAFSLRRLTIDAAGHSSAERWTFPNLYDLLLFARAQGFAEVDPNAEDWQPVGEAS